MVLPILYSFRRCPYAMRARLAIAASGVRVELREVVLRDKPEEMLEASPKATVPVLVLSDGRVIDESREIMDWALKQNDGDDWLNWSATELKEMQDLVGQFDGPFKQALDRYKYANRFENVDAQDEREKGSQYLLKLEKMLVGQNFLYGDRFSYADGAILPFIRQFAHVDIDWFRQQKWPNLIAWLDRFLKSEQFKAIMNKYTQWHSGDDGVVFPG